MSRDNLNSCKVIYFIVVQWISLLYGPFKSRYALKQPTENWMLHYLVDSEIKLSRSDHKNLDGVANYSASLP